MKKKAKQKNKNAKDVFVYEIIKVVGLGVQECPSEEHSTGIIFTTKNTATEEADKLWKKNTTKAERESGWCPLNYDVRKVKIRK